MMSKNKLADKKTDTIVNGIAKKLPKEERTVKELQECEKWSKYGLFKVMMKLKDEVAKLQKQERILPPPVLRIVPASEETSEEELNEKFEAIGERLDELERENTDLEKKNHDLEVEKEDLEEEIEPLRKLKKNLQKVKELLD
jgi:hypothetical protein